MAKNNGGGNGGQGGGNQGAPKVTRGEILVSSLMGQVAQTLGMQIDFTKLPGYDQIMVLARGNPQLAFNSAATFFSTLLKLGDTEKEMVEGLFRALGTKATMTASATDVEQTTEVNQAFGALAEVKALKTLREAGMLGKHDAVPYMEAITHLDIPQRRAVASIVAIIKEFDPTKVMLTPRAARGVALTVLDRNSQTPGQLQALAKELKPLFVPPTGKVEGAANDLIKAAERVKAALAKVTGTPGANGHTFMNQVGGNSAARSTGAALAQDARAQLMRRKGFRP